MRAVPYMTAPAKPDAKSVDLTDVNHRAAEAAIAAAPKSNGTSTRDKLADAKPARD